MTRTSTIVALAAVALAASSASAQTNNHFTRQQREAITRQQTARQRFGHQRTSSGHANVSRQGLGHWGGTTTTRRWYPATNGQIRHQNIQLYPVYPFGYGTLGYGFYGVSPHYRTPRHGVSAGPGVYIRREIYNSR